MTKDKSLKDEPQVLLGHLELWSLVAIFSERIARKARCQLWVISDVQGNLQTQRNHILYFLVSKAFLDKVVSKRI